MDDGDSGSESEGEDAGEVISTRGEECSLDGSNDEREEVAPLRPPVRPKTRKLSTYQGDHATDYERGASARNIKSRRRFPETGAAASV